MLLRKVGTAQLQRCLPLKPRTALSRSIIANPKAARLPQYARLSARPMLASHRSRKILAAARRLPIVSAKRQFAARTNWYHPKQRSSASSAFGSMFSPVILGVAAANCGVFALYLHIKSQKIGAPSFKVWNVRYRMNMAWMYKHFGLSAESIANGRWWTALTCHFAHTSWLSFGVNMVALFTLAAPCAAALGTAGFLQLYALSAVTAATFSLWCTHDYFSSRSLKFFSHSPTVGASGAIAGTFAYSCMTGGSQLLGLVPVQARVLLWAALAFSAGASYFKFFPEVDHGAHIGGMVGGIGLFLLTRRRR